MKALLYHFITRIIPGYIIGCLVASCVALVIFSIVPMYHTHIRTIDDALNLLAISALYGGCIMLLPGLIIIGFAETQNYRSWKIHGFVAGLATIIAYAILTIIIKGPPVMIYRPSQNLFPLSYIGYISFSEWLIAFVMGASAGLVYWSIAGRKAGTWKQA